MTANIDLRELDRYLNSNLSPDDCMGLSDLDGFLTSIVIGPELIMPSECCLWSGETKNLPSGQKRRWKR
jgi:uncharacterized protein